jgi:D-3-phosphoglycerate dehydrogenase
MGRVLVTEELAESGLAAMRAAGNDVDVRLGLSADELLAAVPGAHALVIRSATKVTDDVLAAGRDLVVVGRAGIGLDNVDVAAATRRGVMVVNAPQSNILSAAEHTIALLLAQARNIPQAHAALTAGRWERSKWEGVELHGHVLGIIGLGRIGALVAQRALAFGLRLIAYDPYVSPDRCRQLGIQRRETVEEVVAEADFLTIHVAKTKETMGLIDADLLAKAKPGLRIVNCARGGIVVEQDLHDAIVAGHIGGAALDVFVEEPTTSSPLFSLPQVVVTPHLGASTAEAQDKAGATIAEMVVLALAGDFVPFAVNVNAAEASETVRPFLALAERLGRTMAALSGGLPPELEILYEGGLAEHDTRILTLSVLKGLLTSASDDQVSYVNAPQLAAERGLDVKESTTTTAQDYVNLIVVRGGEHSVSGTIGGVRGEPRIVDVDGHKVDVPPVSHLLVVRNDDRNGMVALVAGILAEAGVGIENMSLGKSPDAPTALMAIATYDAVAETTLARLRSADGIFGVAAIDEP